MTHSLKSCDCIRDYACIVLVGNLLIQIIRYLKYRISAKSEDKLRCNLRVKSMNCLKRNMVY